LRDERILFFHDTAPWLALSFRGSATTVPELLIVRQSVKSLDDPESFARLAYYDRIYWGLGYALQRMEQYILMEIQRYEETGD
jgi:hypothetical protein